MFYPCETNQENSYTMGSCALTKSQRRWRENVRKYNKQHGKMVAKHACRFQKFLKDFGHIGHEYDECMDKQNLIWSIPLDRRTPTRYLICGKSTCDPKDSYSGSCWRGCSEFDTCVDWCMCLHNQKNEPWVTSRYCASELCVKYLHKSAPFSRRRDVGGSELAFPEGGQGPDGTVDGQLASTVLVTSPLDECLANTDKHWGFCSQHCDFPDALFAYNSTLTCTALGDHSRRDLLPIVEKAFFNDTGLGMVLGPELEELFEGAIVEGRKCCTTEMEISTVTAADWGNDDHGVSPMDGCMNRTNYFEFCTENCFLAEELFQHNDATTCAFLSGLDQTGVTDLISDTFLNGTALNFSDSEYVEFIRDPVIKCCAIEIRRQPVALASAADWSLDNRVTALPGLSGTAIGSATVSHLAALAPLTFSTYY